MKAINNIEELKGKIIKKATLLDYDEKFGLIFTDDTYCYIDIHCYGESHSLELGETGDLEDDDLLSLGIITQYDYDKKKEDIRKKYIMEQEKRDMARYEELKKRFGVKE